MDVMNVQRPVSVDRDVASEHGQLVVEPALKFLPIIPVFPPSDKAFDIRERCPIVPFRILQLVWEPMKFQLSVEKLEVFIRDVDLEGFLACLGHDTNDRWSR